MPAKRLNSIVLVVGIIIAAAGAAITVAASITLSPENRYVLMFSYILPNEYILALDTVYMQNM